MRENNKQDDVFHQSITQILRYVAAAIIAAAAILLRLVLDSILGQGVIYSFFYPAIVFTACFLGIGPAIACLVICIIAAAYLWLPPAGIMVAPGGYISLAAFITVSSILLVMTCMAKFGLDRYRRSLASIRQLEKEFRSFFEQSALGVAQVSLDGNFLQVNRRIIQTTGYTMEELLQKQIENLIHPEDRHNYTVNLERLAQGQIQDFSIEERYIRKGGGFVWIRLTLFPLRDDNGNPISYIALMEDIDHRKHEENARRQLEAQFQALLDNSPAVVFAKNLQGKFIFTNPKFRSIFTENKPVNNKSVYDIFPPNEADKLTEHDRKLIETGQATHTEENVSVAGEPRTFIAVRFPLRNTKGEIQGICEIATDITDRKRSEEAVRKSEENFRHFVQSINAVILRLDLQGRLTFINRYGLRLFGYSEDELMNRPVMDTIVPKFETTGRPLAPVLAQLIKAPGQSYSENENITKDGKRYTIAWTNQAIRDSKGHATEILFVGLDITAKKRFENELKASEERFRQTIMAVPFPIAVSTENGEILHLNNAFTQITGYTRNEIPTVHDWLTLVHEQKKAEEIQQQLNNLYKKKDIGEVIEESNIRTKSGNTRTWLIHTIYLGRLPDSRRMLLHASIDVTERKNAEAALRDAKELAESASRAKDEFMSILSHELRTPLTAIMGWVGLLRAKKLPPSAMERGLQIMYESTKAETRLIDDMLDISRVVAGKMSLDFKAITIQQVVAAAVDSIRPAAQAKALHLELQGENKTVMVRGDASRLQQVVYNLLTNAIKFTPKGGAIQASVHRVGSSAVIRVTDTGIGIEPAFLPYLFQRFRQADSSIARRFQGLGLGLAISRHIVELHGGTISAESKGKNKGAVFTVKLPILALKPEAVPAAAAAETRSRIKKGYLKGVRILVVDDDTPSRDLLSTLLKQEQAEVAAAASVSEALAVFSIFKPDLLLADIGLPVEDGYDLIRKIRKKPPEEGGQIPAIAITAFARREDRLMALSSGYQMHISKPVDPEELLDQIESAMRQPSKFAA